MIPQHSSATNEHYTPVEVVEAARRLLGRFDLDPASCDAANERVRAGRILTLADDGLAGDWSGRVFLNPPGGIIRRRADGRWVPHKGGGGESSMGVWWNKLVSEWLSGRVECAVFVAFTLELLRIGQHGRQPVQAFSRCYPTYRLRFGGDSPTHANVLVYLHGPHADFLDFEREFSPLGLCEQGASNHTIHRPPFG